MDGKSWDAGVRMTAEQCTPAAFRIQVVTEKRSVMHFPNGPTHLSFQPFLVAATPGILGLNYEQ
ncbi:hypothetical protein GCM10025794_32590 [Massilia kyonggiensis]|jgi:hypothetical protein